MKKTQFGTVVSDKMQLSAVVQVAVWKTARIINKRYQRHERYLVSNPDNQYKTGDMVEIAETRPQSRKKRWAIVGLASKNVTKAKRKA